MIGGRVPGWPRAASTDGGRPGAGRPCRWARSQPMSRAPGSRAVRGCARCGRGEGLEPGSHEASRPSRFAHPGWRDVHGAMPGRQSADVPVTKRVDRPQRRACRAARAGGLRDPEGGEVARVAARKTDVRRHVYRPGAHIWTKGQRARPSGLPGPLCCPNHPPPTDAGRRVVQSGASRVGSVPAGAALLVD